LKIIKLKKRKKKKDEGWLRQSGGGRNTSVTHGSGSATPKSKKLKNKIKQNKIKGV
jgi:hypothetical protein